MNSSKEELSHFRSEILSCFSFTQHVRVLEKILRRITIHSLDTRAPRPLRAEQLLPALELVMDHFAYDVIGNAKSPIIVSDSTHPLSMIEHQKAKVQYLFLRDIVSMGFIRSFLSFKEFYLRSDQPFNASVSGAAAARTAIENKLLFFLVLAPHLLKDLITVAESQEARTISSANEILEEYPNIHIVDIHNALTTEEIQLEILCARCKLENSSDILNLLKGHYRRITHFINGPPISITGIGNIITSIPPRITLLGIRDYWLENMRSLRQDGPNEYVIISSSGERTYVHFPTVTHVLNQAQRYKLHKSPRGTLVESRELHKIFFRAHSFSVARFESLIKVLDYPLDSHFNDLLTERDLHEWFERLCAQVEQLLDGVMARKDVRLVCRLIIERLILFGFSPLRAQEITIWLLRAIWLQLDEKYDNRR